MDPEQFRQFLANALLQRKRSDNQQLGVSPPTGTFVPRPVPVTFDSASDAVARHVMQHFRVQDPDEAKALARRIITGTSGWGTKADDAAITKAAIDRYHPKGVEFNYVDPSEPNGWGYQPPPVPFALRVAE